MEKISFALMAAGLLKLIIKSDFLEKFEGIFYVCVGSVFYLTIKATEGGAANDFALISFLGFFFVLHVSLVLPFVNGIKNRNTEDLNDLDD